ncbi:MAG: hypothetical protein BWX88_00614 [Planctomycetes bacterium ADurb.Bin126]|nr:MAG: hypothetical protein BWX88_00614 [Planctomycetes bacterium ADurb.Bin126]HOD80898.1 DUF3592 domain-containing protein [Phycisphaerae bacterium]HQL72251.1 DUF3592 domain-containing protein [Phycisphaerae bacterium]
MGTKRIQFGPSLPGLFKAGSFVVRGFMLVFACAWLSGVGTMGAMIVKSLLQEVRKSYAYEPVQARAAALSPRLGTLPPLLPELPEAPQPAQDDEGDEDQQGKLTYGYRVAGREYEGSAWIARTPTSVQQQALDAARAGRSFTVYYDRDDPSRSDLDAVPDVAAFGGLLFMMPFLAIGLGLAGAALFAPPETWMPSRTGRSAGPPGRFLVAPYALLSAGACFGFFALAGRLHWQTALVVGLVLLVAVVPGLSLLIAWAFRRWRRRPDQVPADAPAPPPAESLFPQAAAPKDQGDPRFAPPSPQPAGHDSRFDRPGRESQPAWTPMIIPDLGDDPYSRWRAEQSLRKTMTGLLVFTLFWCGLTGAFCYFVVSVFVQSWHAVNTYVPVGGVVLSSRIKTTHGDSTTYAPLVRYSYQYEGRTFAGERHSFDSSSSSDHRYAHRVVEQYPKGRKITVFVDPADPAQSVLLREVPAQTYFLLLFLQPFVTVGVGMLGATLIVPGRHARVGRFLRDEARLPWNIPTWGRLEQDASGLVIRPRRGLTGPLLALLGGYAIVCFVSIFVLLLWRGLSGVAPGHVRAVLLLGASLGVVLAINALRVRRAAVSIGWDNRTGRLTVDSFARTIDVPMTDVRAFALRGVRNPSRMHSNKDKAHAPLLLALTADGREVPIHVFSADGDGNYVAWKVTRELARLTGKEHRHPAPLPSGRDEFNPAAATSLKDMIAMAKKAQKQAQEYRDLI